MKVKLSILLIFASLGLKAQSGNAILKSGQLNLGTNANGQLAIISNDVSSEFVKGSNNHLFSFINLWISAYDDSSHLYISSANGFNGKTDFSPGPIDSLTDSGAEPSEFNKIWMLSKEEIYNHLKDFNTQGYFPIDAIKTWPGNGYSRFNKYLAPYVDYDQNGKYNPSKGDYPLIEGDNAAYFIVNDNFFEHKASGGQPLKVEIYCMLYSFNDLPNTIFAKYYIKNPTSNSFKDVYASINAGFELGNKNDNYCGTHVVSNTIFSYNGDDNDENHFGNNKPLAMISFLGKNLNSSIYITNDNDSLSGMPAIPEHHRNLMEGKWKNSKSVTFGNDGKGNNQTSKFVYSANTDPDFQSSNWVETNIPGYRSILANTYNSNLLSKDYFTLDFAISGTDNTNKNPYEYVKNKYDEINNYWLAKSLSVKEFKYLENILIQKNPCISGENIYKNEFQIFDKISVFNSVGVQIDEINPKTENILKIENNGLYFIKYYIGKQVYIKKIIII